MNAMSNIDVSTLQDVVVPEEDQPLVECIVVYVRISGSCGGVD
jgi:hypothetical protein